MGNQRKVKRMNVICGLDFLSGIFNIFSEHESFQTVLNIDERKPIESLSLMNFYVRLTVYHLFRQL